MVFSIYLEYVLKSYVVNFIGCVQKFYLHFYLYQKSQNSHNTSWPESTYLFLESTAIVLIWSLESSCYEYTFLISQFSIFYRYFIVYTHFSARILPTSSIFFLFHIHNGLYCAVFSLIIPTNWSLFQHSYVPKKILTSSQQCKSTNLLCIIKLTFYKCSCCMMVLLVLLGAPVQLCTLSSI